MPLELVTDEAILRTLNGTETQSPVPPPSAVQPPPVGTAPPQQYAPATPPQQQQTQSLTPSAEEYLNPKPSGLIPVEDPEILRQLEQGDQSQAPATSFGEVAPGNAQTAPVEQPTGVGDVLTRGVEDTTIAASQKTSPIVRNMDGQFIRNPIGRVVEVDGVLDVETPQGVVHFYETADGEQRVVNPSVEVVLRDPATGEWVVFERNEETDENAAISAFRLAADAFGPSSLPARGAAAVTKLPAATAGRTAAEKVEAFDKAGVNPSIAATSEREMTKKVGQAIIDTPVVGAAAEKAAQTSTRQAAQATDRVSGMFGASNSEDVTGSMISRALDRFTGNVNPNASRAEKEVAARLTSGKTSRGAKAAGLYQRLDDMVPKDTKVKLSNFRGKMADILNRFEDDKLTKATRDPQVAKLDKAFDAGELSWRDARDLRTYVREQFNTTREGPLKNTSQQQKEAIYRALTRDLEDTTKGISRKAFITMKRADRFYGQTADRIAKTLKRVTKSTSGEAAFKILKDATRSAEQGGNINMLRAIRTSVKQEEWNEIASTIIASMGKPRPSAGQFVQEIEFSPSTFMTNYNKMSPKAKNLLFNSTGNKEAAAELDNLAKVIDDLKSVEEFTNRSRSGGVATVGVVATGVADFTAGILSALGTAGVGHLLFSPKFARALAQAPQRMKKLRGTADRIKGAVPEWAKELRANSPGINTQIVFLNAIAKSNPDMEEDIKLVINQISSDNKRSTQKQEDSSRPLLTPGQTPQLR